MQGNRMAALEVWSGPEVPKGDDWLLRSLVGEIKNMEIVPLIRDAFVLEGHNTIQVRYLGDDRVVISGPEGVDLAEILKEPESRLEELVQNMQPWTPSLSTENRMTWVKYYGIPLNM